MWKTNRFKVQSLKKTDFVAVWLSQFPEITLTSGVLVSCGFGVQRFPTKVTGRFNLTVSGLQSTIWSSDVPYTEGVREHLSYLAGGSTGFCKLWSSQQLLHYRNYSLALRDCRKFQGQEIGTNKLVSQTVPGKEVVSFPERVSTDWEGDMTGFVVEVDRGKWSVLYLSPRHAGVHRQGAHVEERRNYSWLWVCRNQQWRWACQKANEPGDKISVPRAWVQKPLQGTLHQSQGLRCLQGAAVLVFTESFLCSRPWSEHQSHWFLYQPDVVLSAATVRLGRAECVHVWRLETLVWPPCNFGFHRARCAFSREAGNQIFFCEILCFSVLAAKGILWSDSLWFRLELCLELWAPHFMGDFDKFENNQKRDCSASPTMWGAPVGLGMLCLEKREPRAVWLQTWVLGRAVLEVKGLLLPRAELQPVSVSNG